MPKFFIDTSDQDLFIYDTEGHNFKDFEAAKLAAVRALSDMVRDQLGQSDDRTFLAIVRDEAGDTLIQARVVFDVRWAPGSPSSPGWSR